MSFVFSPDMTLIQEWMNANKYTQLIAYLRKCQLQSIEDSSVVAKLIDRLHCQSNYLIMIFFLEFLGDYPIQVFGKETNEAFAILLKNSCGIEKGLSGLISKFICKRKQLEHDIVSRALTIFLNQNSHKKDDGLRKEDGYPNDNALYFNMCLEYVQYNKDLPHSFWEKIIQAFQLFNNQFEYAMKLLKLYPLQYSLSEFYWKKQIDTSKDLMHLYTVFNSKYQDRQVNENIDSYRKIFNYFIKAIGDKYSLIDSQSTTDIFNSIIEKGLQIDEEAMRGFVINYTKVNLSSQEKIKNVLVKASTNMTSHIVSDVIDILYEAKELESIIVIINMIKERGIIAEFDLLTINSEVMKEIDSVRIDHANISNLSYFLIQ